MATTVTIGTGVIILTVLWLVTVLSLIIFCSAQGKVKLIGLAPLVISAIVTIVLASLPRGVPERNDSNPSYNYSYTPLIWILIFTAIVVSFVGSLGVYFLTDILEPRYARVTKNFRQFK
jgi:hypothetical protein